MSQQISFTTAVTRALSALSKASGASWKLGDIAGSVKAEYGKDTLGKLAEEIRAGGHDISDATLRNFRTVAGKYSEDDRQTDNPFGIYEVFSRLEDHAQRMQLIRSRVWTVTDARAKVAELKPAKTPVAPVMDAVTVPAVKDNDDQRAGLVNRIATLKAELDLAVARLAEYDTKHPQTDQAADQAADQAKPAQTDQPAKTSSRPTIVYSVCTLASCKAGKHVTGSPIARKHAEQQAA